MFNFIKRKPKLKFIQTEGDKNKRWKMKEV